MVAFLVGEPIIHKPLAMLARPEQLTENAFNVRPHQPDDAADRIPLDQQPQNRVSFFGRHLTHRGVAFFCGSRYNSFVRTELGESLVFVRAPVEKAILTGVFCCPCRATMIVL
jgi:hypothetical protein